jgi:two-component system, LytTR family, response regulator
MKIRQIQTLIVDDELWARRRIASLLKAEPDMRVVGECSTGADAVQSILTHLPDLIFLDVQMPKMDGFEVLDAVPSKRLPLVVFATAYDKYALQAFDVHAVDYLLKPFDAERFRKALNRARDDFQLKNELAQDKLRALLESVQNDRKFLRRLVVKSGGRIVFVRSSDVDWLEASGNYVTLHVGRESHLFRTTMNAIEPKLHPEQFVRIHRSAIVNLDRVKEVQPWFHGEQLLVLKDGTKIHVGRGFRSRLETLLQNEV